MTDRYTAEELKTLTFVKMERVGQWYDFYTTAGEKYSTKYEERANEVVLNTEIEYRIKFDLVSNQHRIMGRTPQR